MLSSGLFEVCDYSLYHFFRFGDYASKSSEMGHWLFSVDGELDIFNHLPGVYLCHQYSTLAFCCLGEGGRREWP